ncbi:MAG TPA: 4-coumarate--CoA ligase family protein [Actinomycetota bacterium]|nr:4-coumarate--CoA ligase family protein [Actinomycetota bacterium]
MIIRSPHPDVTIPDVPLTEFVLGESPGQGDKAALIDGPTGRTLTYSQLAEAVRRVAGGLAERGFGRGDVLGIFCPNVPEFAVTFHAVASLGGISTTINSLYTPDEVAWQLKDAGAKVLVTVAPFMDRAADAAGRTGIQEVFVLGDGSGSDATPFAALLDTDGSAPQPDFDPREDLVVLPYSSGTTGFPKGVMLTHHNLVSNLTQMKPFHHVTPEDRVIGVLPFFHIYGMVVIMNGVLHNGGTVVTMPRFDLEQFLGLMQEHRITRAYLVPPIVLALAKHPLVDRYDLSSLRLILSGAAPLDAGLASACEQRLGCQVIQGYGLTETSPVTNCTPDDDPSGNKPGSIGPLLPNTEARIVSFETGRDETPGQDGEIWIRGPQVMKGYLNNPEATRATIDEDGWLHTGDIGHADEDGYFTIADRLKELIKYKGYQVPPAELEAVLLSHPAISDAAVIPKRDDEAGEVPKAFVVIKAEATADEIMIYVAERVALHKKIREVEFVEEIPKSASGKILRRVLVDRERERAAQGAG